MSGLSSTRCYAHARPAQATSMADHQPDDPTTYDELDAISVELHTWVDHATGHYACHAPEYELTGYGATPDDAERALFDRLEDMLNAPSN